MNNSTLTIRKDKKMKKWDKTCLLAPTAYLWHKLRCHKMTYSIVLILTLVIKPFVATVGWWVCRAANHNATLYLSFTSFLQENI